MSSVVAYCEHFDGLAQNVPLGAEEGFECFFQQRRNDRPCVGIYPVPSGHRIQLWYYVGIDWIVKHQHAIYVEPKLNRESGPQTRYLEMLFAALKHPAVLEHTADLFEIKFDDPYIEIEQEQDLLTPLLVVQFLRVVEEIVRKGLKKSYYKVERHLANRIKGKVLVGQTVKHNLLRNRPLNTACAYEEFGFNGFENRLLKRTLVFVQRYLASASGMTVSRLMTDVFNYIAPAFEPVSEEVELVDIRNHPANVFYKEYSEGVRLARLILRRFGYNIANTPARRRVKVPPFWIDMSKLFELYVFGLLKDRYGNGVSFQQKANFGFVDFLLNTGLEKIVIDAKYKPQYSEGYNGDDIRQLSGYGRDRKILRKLDVPEEEWGSTVLRCLIIYPEIPSPGDSAHVTLELADAEEIGEFEGFFKLPVVVPVSDHLISCGVTNREPS